MEKFKNKYIMFDEAVDDRGSTMATAINNNHKMSYFIMLAVISMRD